MLSMKDFLAILHDLLSSLNVIEYIHYVKSVQIRSYFQSVFSCVGTRNNSVFGHFWHSDRNSN